MTSYHKSTQFMHLMSECSDHLMGTKKWVLIKFKQKIQMVNADKVIAYSLLSKTNVDWVDT